MKNIYSNNKIWEIYHTNSRRAKVLNLYRQMFKVIKGNGEIASIQTNDTIIGAYLESHLQYQFRHGKNFNSINQISESIQTGESVLLILKQLQNDFKERKGSKKSRQIIRFAYCQEGDSKVASIHQFCQSQKLPERLKKQILDENLIFNLPISSQMRSQLIINSQKYKELYDDLFSPSFEDYLLPNRSLLQVLSTKN